jgi:RimJ/RimL family protein N-acetyltransferase
MTPTTALAAITSPPGIPIYERMSGGDWRRYRAIRLTMLEQAPGSYGVTMADEAERSEEEWKHRCRELAEGAAYYAVIDGRDVGFGVATVHPDTNDAVISNLYVAAEWRGEPFQIARMLIGLLHIWAGGEAGLSGTIIEVSPGNARARACYLACGFRPTGGGFTSTHGVWFDELRKEATGPRGSYPVVPH